MHIYQMYCFELINKFIVYNVLLQIYLTENLIKCDQINKNNVAIKQQKRELDPVWYLSKFGYLKTLNSTHKDSLYKMSENLIMYPSKDIRKKTKNFSDVKIQNELSEAIKRFQRFAHLGVSGVLDNETINLMKLPRCGHPDVKGLPPIKNADAGSIFRKRRYALQGSKWLKRHIKYKITKYPLYSTMNKQEIDDEVTRAFELWGSVSQLQFSQVKDTNLFSVFYGSQPIDAADIEIKFETGFHGDSEPFDGPGYILGHAYFPQFGGSTHFDAEEYWTKRSADGVNLYQVAVHEFGHALGLEHSDNFDAIMAPFFRGYTEDFVLNSDDVTAVQYLYGKNPNQINVYGYNKKVADATVPINQHVPNTTPNPFNYDNNPPPANLCIDGSFDAITLMQDGFTYIFKGAYVYKIDSNFVMDINYPKRIRAVFGRWDGMTWVSIPDNIDTALFIPDAGKTYFFKNNLYWRTTLYDLDPGYPKVISDNFRGLDAEHGFDGKLDATFLWSGNGRVYFVRSGRYWRYDLRKMEIEFGYPKSFSVWRGLPARITDALLWSNGVTYFFSDDKYYRFNDLAFKVDEANPPYPRKNSDSWFGCRSRLGNLILDENVTRVNEDKIDKESEAANIEKLLLDTYGDSNDNKHSIDISQDNIADDDDHNNNNEDEEEKPDSDNTLLKKIISMKTNNAQNRNIVTNYSYSFKCERNFKFLFNLFIQLSVILKILFYLN